MNKENYLKKIRATNGSDHTVGNYKTALNHLQRYLEKEDIDVDELDQYDIYGFKNYLIDSVAGSTADQYLTTVQKYLREEVDEDLAEVIKDITINTQSVTERAFDTTTPIIDIDTYKQMVDAATDTRSKLIIQLLWETGIRPQELSNIESEDLDRDNRTITIQTAKIPVDSDRSRTRTVHYSIEMDTVLRYWIDKGGRDKYKTAGRSDYLIVTENSTQIDPNYINTIVSKVAKKADVRREYSSENSTKNQYYPNCRHFRNSFATYRSWNGMDLETLRQLMGHHSVEVTSRYVKEDREEQSKKNEDYRPKTYTDSSVELGRRL